jgi:Fe-S-cluster containining protein
METDLSKIRELGRKRLDENAKFRRYLKFHDHPEHIDYLVHKLYNRIAALIDCAGCRNCCRVLKPEFTMDQVEKISDYLQLDKQEFIYKYLEPEEGAYGIYVSKGLPCSLFKDNQCTCFPVRPQDCKDYPFLQKDDFTQRLLGVIDNYTVCPIVFNVFEELKGILWRNR